jgi:hypothetical protein
MKSRVQSNRPIPFTLFTACLLGSALSATVAGAATNDAAPTRLPEVTVVATNVLREEMPLGNYHQPEWTARRRFVTTRVYVQPEGQVETEVGLDMTAPREGKSQQLIQEEIEIGLPYRFQLDVENADQNFNGDETDRRWHHASNSIELRHALADWGRIPLNPTINLEWKFRNAEADSGEVQLLLGEDLAPRWHWGMNLFYEQQVGDDREREFALSQGLSYTLVDEKLSAGVEMKISSESDKDTRDRPETKFLVGPSFQWRPTQRTHLDVVPMAGMGHESPFAEVFVFFGIEFGPGSKEKEIVSPASLRGK